MPAINDVVLALQGVFQNSSEKEFVIGNKNFQFCLHNYLPNIISSHIKCAHEETLGPKREGFVFSISQSWDTFPQTLLDPQTKKPN
jgi:hypothetical protein